MSYTYLLYPNCAYVVTVISQGSTIELPNGVDLESVVATDGTPIGFTVDHGTDISVTKGKQVTTGKLISVDGSTVRVSVGDKILTVRDYDFTEESTRCSITFDKKCKNLHMSYILRSVSWTCNYRMDWVDDKCTVTPMITVQNRSGKILKGDMSVITTDFIGDTSSPMNETVMYSQARSIAKEESAIADQTPLFTKCLTVKPGETHIPLDPYTLDLHKVYQMSVDRSGIMHPQYGYKFASSKMMPPGRAVFVENGISGIDHLPLLSEHQSYTSWMGNTTAIGGEVLVTKTKRSEHSTQVDINITWSNTLDTSVLVTLKYPRYNAVYSPVSGMSPHTEVSGDYITWSNIIPSDHSSTRHSFMLNDN